MKTACKLAILLDQTLFDRSPYRFFPETQAQVLLSLLQPKFLGDLYREQDPAQFLDHIIGYPTMNSVLHIFSLTVPSMASETPILPNPNVANAKRLYFIRYLSAYLRHTYDTPLHSVVAATARAILDDRDIDEDIVRAALRHYTP